MKRITFISFLIVLIGLLSGSFCTLSGQSAKGLSSLGDSSKRKKSLIYFRSGKTNVEVDYMDNRSALREVFSTITPRELEYIDSIKIRGSASPEGKTLTNEQLSLQRALSVRDYISISYPYIPISKIYATSIGEDWDGLKKLVLSDYNTPMRDRILYILDYIPADIDVVRNTSRKKAILALGPIPWNYMLKHHFPQLRAGATVTLIYKKNYTPAPPPKADTVKLVSKDTVYKEKVVKDTVYTEKIIKDTIKLTPKVEYFTKPLFALKSNLLFDLLSVLNLELEVPLGRHWSLSGECLFSWWTWSNNTISSKQHRLQILNANFSGRYWFSTNPQRSVLTGWFGGLYVGFGLYDLSYDKQGYQGDFSLSGGLIAGYAHPISKHLRLEYSIGLGYIDTDYEHYTDTWSNVDNRYHPIVEYKEHKSYFGPTTAKVSLVWMLNYKTTKK